MKILRQMTSWISIVLLCTACSDQWDEHYNQNSLTADGAVQLFDGSVAAYIQSQADLSAQDALFAAAGIYEQMDPAHNYTVIVYPDEVFQKSEYATNTAYAAYCLSDAAISPNELVDGLGIHTWRGKNIWVYNRNGKFQIDNYAIDRMVKASNGYIYWIKEGVVPIRSSVYEVLQNLDDTRYSTFKAMVKSYERTYFDASLCTPAGTNAMGNTVYSDSAKGWQVKNLLMDRYTDEGVNLWNMRSEDYVTTLLIPSNEVIKAALDTALAKIPLYLRRSVTEADRVKFERWIVQACFINQRLSAGQLTGTADLYAVAGYTKDSLKGTSYTQVEAPMWRPTVQKVRTDNALYSSNGISYFVDYLKIPNNVVIYRLKSRFYELWNNMSVEQRDTYFRWNHWTDPLVLNDVQTAFKLSETMPVIYYHVLSAMPDKEARLGALPCSVTFDGVLYNEDNERSKRIQPCYLPAGEYYFCVGFKNSLEYSISIQFNDSTYIKDLILYVQGSNIHLDRGSVSVVDYFEDAAIGYPEGYNWKDWSALSSKAQAYDTDGFQVGIVTIPEDGNFTITYTSPDMSRLYDYNADRTKSNVRQLMMYHWCLRPTKNNY